MSAGTRKAYEHAHNEAVRTIKKRALKGPLLTFRR